MKLSHSYWDERVKKFGHTGLNNKFLYAYEQNLRKSVLKRISNWLVNRNISNPRVLDFGCGTAKLGLSFSHSIKASSYTGYDVSALVLKKAYENTANELPFCASFSENINIISSQKYDVILAITVLQHIDISELQATFDLFRRLLNPGGTIVILDNCYDIDSTSDYIRISFSKADLVSCYSRFFKTNPALTIPHPSVTLSFFSRLYSLSIFDKSLSARIFRKFFSLVCLPFLFLIELLIPAKSFSKYLWIVFEA